MAKLEGKAALIGPEWFSLKPLKNKIEGQDATEYLLELWPGPNDNIFTRTFSVVGWQMHQDDVWVLARAFAEAPKLPEAIIANDLWRTGKPSHAYLYESATWLHAILWGNKHRQGVAIRLFIQEQDGAQTFRSFFIQASAAQVAKFGLELEREIIEASPHWASERELLPPSTTGQ